MIAALRFDRTGTPRFEAVTNVRISAVCSVANAVADHLSRLLEREVSIDVFEPRYVPLGSQPALFSNASVFRAHARRSDLLVVFRERDARRLAACAFREEAESAPSRELSALEEQVLERLGREVAHLSAPLCGDVVSYAPAHGPVELYECATYFELRLAPPIDIVIGLGLSRDPVPASDAKVARALLDPVCIPLHARLARARLTASALMRLRVGGVITFDTLLTDPATLIAGPAVVATGECGVRDGVMAFHVTKRGGGDS